MRSDVALGEPATDDVGPRVRPQAKPGDPGAPTRSAPFRLGPRGRPETAILWKNLILVARGAKMSGLLRLSSVPIVFGVVLARRGSNDVTAIVWIASLALAAMTTLMGPQIARNDLRQDLAHLATLKTWPLSGAVIVRGELMGPTVVLTLTAWLLLALAATVAGTPIAQFKVPGISGPSVVVAAMVLVPGLVLLQVTLHNALALMFPAWAQIGATRTAGVEHMGQRLVLVYGGLFAVLIAILPAAVIVLVVGFAIRQVTRSYPWCRWRSSRSGCCWSKPARQSSFLAVASTTWTPARFRRPNEHDAAPPAGVARLARLRVDGPGGHSVRALRQLSTCSYGHYGIAQDRDWQDSEVRAARPARGDCPAVA